MADPEIWLGATPCGESRHSARGGQFNMFPSIWRFFFIYGRPSL